ncbi:hypothetical protein GGX14DRAFT_404142 [Mycena pura]|uniref:Uncharacterized protein n=1 Tax=Mycena pura TaxID=153505 RepID=A0AAD6Y7U1_9AGAR|nr:hypothetical protein GGX14DRAFT_404142 [Mycena pura]
MQANTSSFEQSHASRPGMFDEPASNWEPRPSPPLNYFAGSLGDDSDLIDISMEPFHHDPEVERKNLARQALEMLLRAEELDEFDLDEDDEVSDDIPEGDPQYFPYPNRVNMLLDIIDNLPRLRLSTSHFKIILWLLKQCHVRNVPSYNAFRKLQTGLEEVTGPVSEVWQAERWKEISPSELTPMFSRGLRQFYINEVAEMDDGMKVIPIAWIKRNGELCGDCLEVVPDTAGWKVLPPREKPSNFIPVSRFRYNYYDIVERVGDQITWAADTPNFQMPDSMRNLADGDDLYVVFIPLWADDVSGNKSKQYNKHMNVYMVNSNLPGQLLQQEFFVRFVSTSPSASSPEQFSAIKKQIVETQKDPIWCILRVPGLPADNPQQSEEASHLGGNANLKCRRCMVGGPHEHTESDEGYHALHLPGIARTAAETKETLLKQIHLAMYGVKARIDELQTATGVKDKAREMQSNAPGRTNDAIAAELKVWFDAQPGDKVNPLLDIAGLDPNRDTPVEILHTILLGIMKYTWHMLWSSWSAKEAELFTIRLQSTDIDGLDIPPIRAAYMMQYKNNLIGKHFKTLIVTSRALLIASELDRLRSMMSSPGPAPPDDVVTWFRNRRCSDALSGLPHLILGLPALMVVYPASWSIRIIGPAWSLIVLYFAPALALWRIGTPVDSQILPAPSGCLPNAPSALRDLIRALCNHSRYSEPFTYLRLQFCDFGPALCLCQFIDPACIPTLAPRYTDGTPRAHPSSVQLSSVFRALHLLATSSLCLRHRISARFHPASLPDPCALVRSTVGPLV